MEQIWDQKITIENDFKVILMLTVLALGSVNEDDLIKPSEWQDSRRTSPLSIRGGGPP